MESKPLNAGMNIINSIIAEKGSCGGIMCIECPIYKDNVWDGCGSNEESLMLAERLLHPEKEDDLETKMLEHLVQNEGVCYGLPCQLCPIFDSCECESRADILSAASSALERMGKRVKSGYRKVKWISEKSGKTLTGLQVAEVLGRAIIVSEKDASKVVSVGLDKLLK